jgi:hypothetical protein
VEQRIRSSGGNIIKRLTFSEVTTTNDEYTCTYEPILEEARPAYFCYFSIRTKIALFLMLA